jgi:hypothetical protein
LGVVEHGLGQIRPAQIRVAQVGIPEVRPAEIGVGQPGAAEADPSCSGVEEDGALQVTLVEGRSTQIGALTVQISCLAAARTHRAEAGAPDTGPVEEACAQI